MSFKIPYIVIGLLLIAFVVFMMRSLRPSNFTELGTSIGVKGAVATEGADKIKNLAPEDAQPLK